MDDKNTNQSGNDSQQIAEEVTPVIPAVQVEESGISNMESTEEVKTESSELTNPFAALKEDNSEAKMGESEENKEIAADEMQSDTESSEIKESAASEDSAEATEEPAAEEAKSDEEVSEEPKQEEPAKPTNPNARWYVVHTFAGHENKVAAALKQRIEAEHLENLIFDILVPTQDKIEIRGGKKETVKEKIFPGYILIKMELNDLSWLAVRTTQGVTSFIGAGNKPTPISEAEVATIVKFTSQGAQPTFKDVFMVDDTVKIVDGPFAEFIGKVDSVDKEKGRVRVLVSIFGRETPVELDFLQVQKL